MVHAASGKNDDPVQLPMPGLLYETGGMIPGQDSRYRIIRPKVHRIGTLEIDGNEFNAPDTAFFHHITQGLCTETKIDNEIQPVIQEYIHVLDRRKKPVAGFPDDKRKIIIGGGAFLYAVINRLDKIAPYIDQQADTVFPPLADF
jgi:hypothetical protein